jgi:hypothetical protein
VTPTASGSTRVAVVAVDDARSELNDVRSRLQAAGASVALVPSEVSFENAHPSSFAGLVLLDSAPDAGGVKAVQAVREFMVADKPVAAIGKGVSLHIAADAVPGRSIAAPSELQDDVKDVGGSLAGAPIHADENLITARSMKDLHLFLDRVARGFAARAEERLIDQVSEQSFPASDPPPGPGTIGGPRNDRDARF